MRRRAGLAAAALVAAAAALPGPAVAGDRGGSGPADLAGVVAKRISEAPGEVRDYWTPARMRAAEPASLPVGAAGRSSAEARRRSAVDASSASVAFPDRTHGKVFFTIVGGAAPGDYLCSGTVVRSNSHTLVWTAGHCVTDAAFGGGFATNWVFVPGYRRDERPFGVWAARELISSEDWRDSANVRFDLGVAVVERDEQGRGVEDVVGGRPIAFGQPRSQAYNAFGYPAIATLFRRDFDGQRLYACVSARTGDDSPPGTGPAPIEIACDMTGGASGGGWISQDGFLTSVTSYGYGGDTGHLYGPYLGSAAALLYADAQGPPLVCAGRAVTNLGGAARNDYAGGPRNDGISLAAGTDRGRGKSGRDGLCGGAGGDRLDGGPGRDALTGGAGRDVLIGGPGLDICVGGPGRDRAIGCERRLRIR